MVLQRPPTMLNPLTRSLAALSISLIPFSQYATAQDGSDSIPAAVFTTNPSGSGQLAFALNIDASTNDLYFHLSAPASNAWMAVGLGSSHMKDAFMLIAYPSSNGTGMTLSPRLGKGHTEPEHTDNIKCEMIWAEDLYGANSVTDGVGENEGTDIMVVDAVCRSAAKWPTGELAYAGDGNTTNPFIYAVGPGPHGGGPGGHHHSDTGLYSDSPSAGLERHEYYGHFTMDLSHAVSDTTASAGVPRGNAPDSLNTYTLAHATAGPSSSDHDPAPLIHGFIMCLTFVIIYPLGALLLRLLERKGLLLHAAIQTLGFLLTTMATAGGLAISRLYLRSKAITSAHQILGLLIWIALAFQLGLGILHHRLFKKHQRPTLLGKIHRYLGPTALLLGIINAPIGFRFAGNARLGIPYAIVVVVVVILLLLARKFLPRCFGRGAAKQAGVSYMPPPSGGPYQGGGGGGLAAPGYGREAHAVSYEHLGPPPAYGGNTSYRGAGEEVPLQSYEGEQRREQVGVQFPRPVV